MSRSALLVALLALLSMATGCPERRHEPTPPEQHAATVAATVSDDPPDDDDPGVDDPTMGEPPAEPLDVDHMSDEELETACFEGSQAACDQLGH